MGIRQSPHVSIIIPVFNQVEYTRFCLEALWKNSGGISYEVLIADDASTDGTAEFASGLGEKIRWIRSDANRGFILNCNGAAAQAKGDFLVFLNNDTLPQKGWLEALLRPMEDPTVGVTGARMVWPDGRTLEAGSIVFSDGTAWNFGRGEPPTQPRFNHIREVDYVSGGGMMIRHSLWKQLGGFDVRYCPAYYDDIDLCFAVRKAGFKVVYTPFSWIVHFEGVTGGKDLSTGVKRYQVVNKEKFREKWREELKDRYDHDPANVTRACWRGEGKQVLWIDHMLPVPNFNSGCLRMNHLLRTMIRQGHRITYATLVGTDPGNYGHTMQEMGVRVAHLGYEEWEFVDPQKKDLILNKVLDALELEAMHYDVVYLSFYWVGMHFIGKIRRRLPGAIIYVDSHDIHYLRTAREAELHPDDQHIQRAAQTRRDELSVYGRADAVLTVTEQDREVLTKDLPGIPVFLMPNVHDVVKRGNGFTDRKDLLFVGGFNHTPNVDAMVYFCREVFPAVSRRIPGIKLWIVGSNPSEDVKSLAGDDVVVTGWVESTKPYLDTCRISIAPIRYGAGMKGKVGEAMAHGLPVVTTPMGAEGMDIQHERHALVASSVEEWINAIVRLYGDEELWLKLSAGGQELMQQRYGTPAMEARTRSILSHSTRHQVAQAGGVTSSRRSAGLVSIVVLTHNQLSYTKECLASIRKCTPHPHELIFVDNASTDGTPEFLEHDPLVMVIRNKTNEGFPAGCNQGIRASRGEFVLLLNNDTVVTEGWLDRLIEAADRNPMVGIVGPMSNAVSGAQLVKDPNYKTMAEMKHFARTFFRKNRGQTLDFPRVAFLCALIKRDVFDAIGGLDERFSPGNYEDDDFCLRVQLAGFRTLIVQDVFVHHYGSVSFKADGNAAYADRLTANKGIFIRKWGFSPNDIWLKGKLPRDRKPAEPFGEDAPRRYIELAKILIGDHEMDLAMRALNRALEEHQAPSGLNREELLDLCGNAALAAGKIRDAQIWFEEERGLNASSTKALVGLGKVSLALGNRQSAIQLFENALAINPLDQPAVDCLAQVRMCESVPHAVSTFDSRKNSGDSRKPDSLSELEELFARGEFEEAFAASVHFYESLGEGVPTEKKRLIQSNLSNFAGSCLLKTGDLNGAKEQFENSLALNPSSSAACAGLGEVFSMASLDREAKTMFEWAVKNDPSNATAREGLLGANRALGLADDDCSLRCEPDSPSGLDEGGGLAPPIHEEALSPQHSALQGEHLCSSVGKSLGHP